MKNGEIKKLKSRGKSMSLTYTSAIAKQNQSNVFDNYNFNIPEKEYKNRLKERKGTDYIKFAYETWKNSLDKNIITAIKNYNYSAIDFAYEQACNLLKDTEFNSWQEIFEDILDWKDENNFNADCNYLNGLFISALLNEGNKDLLEYKWKHENLKLLGFRLKHGRIIIIKELSKVGEVGIYAEGDILNFGSIKCSMAVRSTGGIQINIGIVNGNMAFKSFAGTQINTFYVGRNFAYMTEGGMQINFGNVGCYIAHCTSGSKQLNFGYPRNKMTDHTSHAYREDKELKRIVNRLKNELEYYKIFPLKDVYEMLNKTKNIVNDIYAYFNKVKL